VSAILKIRGCLVDLIGSNDDLPCHGSALPAAPQAHSGKTTLLLSRSHPIRQHLSVLPTRTNRYFSPNSYPSGSPPREQSHALCTQSSIIRLVERNRAAAVLRRLVLVPSFSRCANQLGSLVQYWIYPHVQDRRARSVGLISSNFHEGPHPRKHGGPVLISAS